MVDSGKTCLKCGATKRLYGSKESAAGIFTRCPICSAEKQRIWRRGKLERNRAKNEAWKAANREKYLAHKAVESSVKSGSLVRQPCERCGSNDLVHAHHDDYSRRLDVIWLCPTHHRERHRELAAKVSANAA